MIQSSWKLHVGSSHIRVCCVLRVILHCLQVCSFKNRTRDCSSCFLDGPKCAENSIEDWILLRPAFLLLMILRSRNDLRHEYGTEAQCHLSKKHAKSF